MSRSSDGDVEEVAMTPAESVPGTRQPHTSGGIWLSTPNWLLMLVTPAHAPLIARMHERNGDHFRWAMSLEPAMSQASFWEPLLAQQQRAYLDGTGLFLVGFHKKAKLPEIGCVINFMGIVHDEFDCCWLGYRVDRSLEGRGLMYEAVMCAIESVFERYELHRIMASHQPENLRSARLLRRLGFGIEGYARDYMKVNGQWRDNVLLALLAPAALKQSATQNDALMYSTFQSDPQCSADEERIKWKFAPPS